MPPFTHGNDFAAYFLVEENDEHFFLLVDDIDELHAASSDVLHDFLGTLRFLQECRRADYSLDGLIATGTLSAPSTPLIVFEGTQIPYFSFPQVESLFHDFQKDNHFTLNPDIVKEIWINSGGYASISALVLFMTENTHAAIPQLYAYVGSSFMTSSGPQMTTRMSLSPTGNRIQSMSYMNGSVATLLTRRCCNLFRILTPTTLLLFSTITSLAILAPFTLAPRKRRNLLTS